MERRLRSGPGRRVLLAVGAATSFLALLESLSCTRAPTDGPVIPRNAVLITIDTLRADHLGCYGYDRPTSPNIDRLAAASIRFANAVSTSSWTLPAHASILTGLYPSEHGVEQDITALPESATTVASVLREQNFDTFGAVSHVYLSRRWGFDNGFAEFDERPAIEAPQRAVAGEVVDSLLAWLDGRGDQRRFFAWIHIFDPHWDYNPPAEFLHRFDADYHGDMRGDYASLAPFIKAVAGYEQPPPIRDRDLEHLIARYDGEIAYVDSQIGRLLSGLEERALANDTMVVLTADHGEEFMEHGSLEGHQWTLYDEVVMVPLIVSLPGAHNGRVIEDVVSTVAIGGTILHTLGIAADWRSLQSVMEGDDVPAPEESAALLDLTVRRHARQVGLRTRDYKLIRHDNGAVELYHRPSEGEHENLAHRRTRTAEQLERRLDARLAKLKRLDDAGAKRKPIDQIIIERLRATGYVD